MNSRQKFLTPYYQRHNQEYLESLGLSIACKTVLEVGSRFDDEELINLTSETIDDSTQALRGTGCRPTRPWIFKTLKNLFSFVYLTKKQPWHEEFPTDWTNLPGRNGESLSRSVFVASKTPLCNLELSTELLNYQER
jgi:hypothetical protein